MKRQLSILVSLFLLLILVFPSSGQGKTTVFQSAGSPSLNRITAQDHTNLCQAGTKVLDDADDDTDEDSDSDYTHDVYLHLPVVVHTTTVTLSVAADLYLKSASNHLFTPDLFLSNRTLRL